jgi:hypothetical protein
MIMELKFECKVRRKVLALSGKGFGTKMANVVMHTEVWVFGEYYSVSTLPGLMVTSVTEGRTQKLPPKFKIV